MSLVHPLVFSAHVAKVFAVNGASRKQFSTKLWLTKGITWKWPILSQDRSHTRKQCQFNDLLLKGTVGKQTCGYIADSVFTIRGKLRLSLVRGSWGISSHGHKWLECTTGQWKAKQKNLTDVFRARERGSILFKLLAHKVNAQSSKRQKFPQGNVVTLENWCVRAHMLQFQVQLVSSSPCARISLGLCPYTCSWSWVQVGVGSCPWYLRIQEGTWPHPPVLSFFSWSTHTHTNTHTHNVNRKLLCGRMSGCCHHGRPLCLVGEQSSTTNLQLFLRYYSILKLFFAPPPPPWFWASWGQAPALGDLKKPVKVSLLRWVFRCLIFVDLARFSTA